MAALPPRYSPNGSYTVTLRVPNVGTMRTVRFDITDNHVISDSAGVVQPGTFFDIDIVQAIKRAFNVPLERQIKLVDMTMGIVLEERGGLHNTGLVMDTVSCFITTSAPRK
jgi:hypothetical protein